MGRGLLTWGDVDASDQGRSGCLVAINLLNHRDEIRYGVVTVADGGS